MNLIDIVVLIIIYIAFETLFLGISRFIGYWTIKLLSFNRLARDDSSPFFIGLGALEIIGAIYLGFNLIR